MSKIETVTTRRLAGSRQSFAAGSARLAGGVSTAFRSSERPVPLVLRSASGSHVVDIDGNDYVDFVCGFGPVILGHGHPAVTAAVTASARSGVQQIGAQHEGEYELAEALCRLVPAFERVRLSVSGSEAVHGALRAARAATGRSLVVKFAGHYHGWLDPIYVGASSPAPGRPESPLGQAPGALGDTLVVDWNDLEVVERLFAERGTEIAAAIMEPVSCNGGYVEPAAGYLERVRELTTAHGALLVFDEVITGFRLGLAGAQGRVGVIPDLAIVAKAMANGYPISAFGGSDDAMDLVAENQAVHAGTYNGGGISVAASLATLAELEADAPVYDRMAGLGQMLVDALPALGERHGFRIVTAGPGPVVFAWFLAEGEVRSFADHLRADAVLYAAFAEQMLLEGVRLIPSGRFFLTASHDAEDIERTLAAADAALASLAIERDR
jgi:glutamate-1-semialdehyde 2,1-aminomutase